MSDWNKELPDFKAARRGEVELRPITGGKRQPRKWRVYSTICGYEYIAHRAASKELCEAWVEKQRCSFYVGRRNAPQVIFDAAKLRAEKRADTYRIEGPKEFAKEAPCQE